jgi:hypothetical protein
MKTICALALAACMTCVGEGLPARSGPDQYTAKAEVAGNVIAATVIPADQVRNEFSTTLVPQYQVLEVAVYPGKGGSAEVNTMDFGLRVDGRFIRPAAPKTIAAMNQKKARAGSRDILLYPTVGVATGSYGTGTAVGVGVGVGDNNPGPASSDQDRRVMQSELEDRALQDMTADKPVAGYLYFPVGETRARSVELVYQHDTGEAKLSLQLPKTK